MSKRKVCVVTGTRAEYGLFYPILKRIQNSDLLELQLVVSTMHLSTEFGLTYKEIEEDGFFVDDKIENLLSADTKSSIAKSTGLGIILLSESFKRLKPDVLLLIGDRFETHAAATTAMLMNIPITHIGGGEITEGAVDEQIRHSITKMSNLHFTSTEEYKQRVISMGEHPEKVFHSGAPGIDNIKSLNTISKSELEKKLEWSFGEKNALFTYHSVTLSPGDTEKDIQKIILTLIKTDLNILFTYANADDGGRLINSFIEKYCKAYPSRFKAVKSLGQIRYLSAMKHVDLLIGNSSSGIIEAASFNKPVINIGSRQKGRLQSGNIINSEIDELYESIKIGLSEDFLSLCHSVENIYGNGNAADIIVNRIEKSNMITVKQFYREQTNERY
jgi:GDP/UDP-N,N'-diacetylbacillosamine 2-epimerase (hydrolysing)